MSTNRPPDNEATEQPRGSPETPAEALPSLPTPPARVHFIGIGGVGMSGLAKILQHRGYVVTGSDAVLSEHAKALADRGVEIVIGHDDPTLAGQADILVTTLRAEVAAHTEIEAAERNGALRIKRGVLLGLVADELRSVAVAGTHGKSTTTGMLTSALMALDADPTYAIGAVLSQTGTNAAPGSGPFMTIEADEFDRSFLALRPEVGIVTKVSFDHPDIFTDQDDYDAAFVAFCQQIRDGGTLVIASDDPGCRRVIQTVREQGDPAFQVVTFGEDEDADWRVSGEGPTWTLTMPDDSTIPFALKVPGRHNARNAAAAAVALHAFGFEPEPIAAALGTFDGIGRRFEHKGTRAGIDVVDDYAHHPEEIPTVFAGARERYPGRRVIAVHQPHTFSRTKLLLDEFATALSDADEVVLMDIYPSGETDTLGVSSEDLRQRITTSVSLVTDTKEAAERVAEIARPGDVVLTIGAGTVTAVGAMVLSRLEAQEENNGVQTRVEGTQAPQRTKSGASGIVIPADAPGLKVQRDFSMSLATTMRVGGPADYLVRAGSPDDIVAATRWAASEGLPVTVIGGGTNLLVSDRGIRGLVIIAKVPGQRAEALLETEDQGGLVEVAVGAQAPLTWVGRYCAERGWSGMEWGVGLPGQIGGATVNNAGAHGTEMKDHLVALDVLHESGDIERLPASWLQPTYRMTRIKGTPRPRPWIVLRSVMHLPKAEVEPLIRSADEHAAFRDRTQPTGACSGSTFANPDGDYAGRLLEAAGMKGFTIGNMGFSQKHANWVVNLGGGTAEEAWALIEHGREAVQEQFGVTLRPEIERVGEQP